MHPFSWFIGFILWLIWTQSEAAGVPAAIGRWPLTPDTENYYFCPFPDDGPNGHHLTFYTQGSCQFVKQANPDPASVGALPASVYYFNCGWGDFLAPPGDRKLKGTDLTGRNITVSWYMYSPLNAKNNDGTIFNFYNESADVWGYHIHQNSNDKTFTFETKNTEEQFTTNCYTEETWNFFTLTYDGANNKVALYKNTVLYQEYSVEPETLVTTQFAFEVGRDLHGYLYCLQLYDELFTLEQIQMTKLIAENQCKRLDDNGQGKITRLKAQLYKRDSRMDSPGNLIKTTTTRSTGSCVTLCDLTCACVALNVKQRSNGAFECELFRSNPTAPEVVASTGWKIYLLSSTWCSKRAAVPCKP